ncbi:hypothetical protein USB125703_00807 [Pseudoclavibacter triregionum]|nr:hypothetical protein USB125703_00807 [Pseudoclavibacter triregionum]
MDRIDRELAHGAGIVSLRALVAGGLPREEAKAAVRRRGLTRLRPGWFAAAGADPEACRAVAAGGALTCVDALKRLGCWVPPSASGLHVRFADRAPTAAHPSLATHVMPRSTGVKPVLAAIDPADLAAICLVRCIPRDDAVAVFDSALRLGAIDAGSLDRVLRASQAGGLIAEALDPSAESGIESYLRLLLRRLRLDFAVQVRIVGVGRVDFLVGDRLVIEADGRAWHSQPAAIQLDADRANALRRLGFDILRFTYADIIHEPDKVAQTIMTAVRRRDHRWTDTNRTWARLGLPDPNLGPAESPAALRWAARRTA